MPRIIPFDRQLALSGVQHFNLQYQINLDPKVPFTNRESIIDGHLWPPQVARRDLETHLKFADGPVFEIHLVTQGTNQRTLLFR